MKKSVERKEEERGMEIVDLTEEGRREAVCRPLSPYLYHAARAERCSVLDQAGWIRDLP
jgi:hypothetical protein